MSKRTPGPWKVVGPYKEGGYLDCGYLISTGYAAHEPEHDIGDDGTEPLHGAKTGFSEADARLIAAAPDLLDACRRVDDLIGDFVTRKGLPRAQEVVNAVREAIAKAEGTSL